MSSRVWPCCDTLNSGSHRAGPFPAPFGLLWSLDTAGAPWAGQAHKKPYFCFLFFPIFPPWYLSDQWWAQPTNELHEIMTPRVTADWLYVHHSQQSCGCRSLSNEAKYFSKYFHGVKSHAQTTCKPIWCLLTCCYPLITCV